MAQEDLSPEEVAEYEKRLAEGAKKFQAKDFKGARVELERAHKLFANPRILFSIASTYRRQGKDSEAVKAYKRFLDDCASEVCRVENKEQITIAEETIEELEPEEPDPVSPPKKDTSTGSGAQTWVLSGIATMGVGLIGVGVAGGFQYRAASLESEIEDELAENGNVWTSELATKETDGEDAKKKARIFGISGGVVAAVGIGLLVYGLTSDGDVEDQDELALSPMVGPSGQSAGLVISGSF